ncbi:amino acid ABC transporter permease [Massilia timonae]|uniref:Amino ABC transporter, permease, 3-TM region, His/Glu/Gln/Arg/opine family domain protein n=2 Tax=Massilia timonae TaxID=47229 RepID=A0A1S2NF14_9BURK|nr:amino acid ABC transporter permease [Massilia timonae]OIJ43443.1 amino ABC transporter, permease, 3-TM region, His/Glu/Gln/Arg/opine family domain protein [Massilia timonae]
MLELIDTYWLYFLVGQYPEGPLGGLVLTILLSGAALVLAMPLGLLLGIARVSPYRAISLPVAGLVQVVRAVPLLLVLFWVYFFLPAVTGVKTSQATTMLMVLVVFDSVYLAEIVAAGLRALPKGQLESARSLGLGYGAALRHVVLPQTLRHGLPSIVNQLVSTIKATSLGYIIGLSEVSFIATQINTLVFTQAVEVYLILALTYFILCFGLSRLAFLLERRLQRRSAQAS